MFEYTDADKTKYAESLIRDNGDAFAAAARAFGTAQESLGKRLWVATTWPEDDFVKRERARLQEESPELFLPSKDEALQLAWQWARGDKPVTKERIDSLRFFCEMNGYVKQSGNAHLIPPLIQFVLDDDSDGNSQSSPQAQSTAA